MADVAPAAPAAPAPTDIIGRIDALIAAEVPDSAPAEPQAPAQPEIPDAEAPAEPQVEGGDAPADAQATELSLDELEAIELDVTTKGEDGKDVAEKLTVKALRDGYLRQADYSRKTAEVARQREQLQAETRKAVEAERLQYVKELQTMHDLVMQTAASELQGVNMDDLARNDPFKYVELDNRQKQITKALGAIRGKQQEVITKFQAEQKAATQQAAAQARTQLESDIPGWNDATYQSLMKAGIDKFGFKQEEVTTWIDPRMFKLLHAAQAGEKVKDQTRTETPAPAKRVVVVPRVVKPGAQTAQTQARAGHAEAMKRLQTDGKIDSVAAVLRARGI